MKKISLLIYSILIHLTLCAQGDSELMSATNLYNQGVQSFESEKYGDAVYFFEKSLLLDPRDEATAINLELSKERLDTDIVELDQFFLMDWWQGCYNTLSPGTWKILSLMLLVGLLAVTYVFLFRSGVISRVKYWVLVSVISLLFLIAILAGNSRVDSIFNNRYAIADASAQALYRGPDQVSEQIKPLVDGVKLEILDQDGDWYKVATLNKEQGWIPKADVRLLSF